MISAIETYTGGGLVPWQDPGYAQEDNVNLAAGKTYAQGTALGFLIGTGTAVAEVQTLTPTGTISGGTFIITFNGVNSSALAFNASAATIQAALEAMSNIGTGGVVCAGGPISTTPVTITFALTLAGQAQNLVTIINSLTGTTPVITPTRTTLGKPANGYWDAYNDASSGSFASLATMRRVLRYACVTDETGKIYPSDTVRFSNNSTFSRSISAYSRGIFKCADIVGLDANGVTDVGRLIVGTAYNETTPAAVILMG